VWQQNCSRTTDGACKHLFPIFMNYGLYKSQSPEPYVTTTRTPPLFAAGAAQCTAACSQVHTETRRGAKKNVVPVPCGTCTQLQERTAERRNKRLSYEILTHPRDLQLCVRIITEISRAINNSLSFRRLPALCV